MTNAMHPTEYLTVNPYALCVLRSMVPGKLGCGPQPAWRMAQSMVADFESMGLVNVIAGEVSLTQGGLALAK